MPRSPGRKQRGNDGRLGHSSRAAAEADFGTPCANCLYQTSFYHVEESVLQGRTFFFINAVLLFRYANLRHKSGERIPLLPHDEILKVERTGRGAVNSEGGIIVYAKCLVASWNKRRSHLCEVPSPNLPNYCQVVILLPHHLWSLDLLLRFLSLSGTNPMIGPQGFFHSVCGQYDIIPSYSFGSSCRRRTFFCNTYHRSESPSIYAPTQTSSGCKFVRLSTEEVKDGGLRTTS